MSNKSVSIFKVIKEDALCVLERDPAARNLFEVVTTCAGFHAVLWHRLNHKIWNLGLLWLAKLLSNIPRLYTGVEIHPGAIIGERFFIDHGFGIVIGATAEIGDDCSIYQGTTLGGVTFERNTKRHPTLKNNVIVGAGAKILGAITINDGAKVGSNAVVLKDVPSNATVIGVPAIEAEKKSTKSESQTTFAAYGFEPDSDDPVSHIVENMHKRVKKLEEELREIKDKNN